MSDYPCAYCHRAMDRKRQPHLAYAQCWECWAQEQTEATEAWKSTADTWITVAIVLLFGGFALGWLSAGWLT